MAASARLRAALLRVAPWLTDPDHGPTTVDAGACPQCELAPRLLATCGPSAPEALCRACALAAGDEAWCDGHLEEGRRARRWAATLPPRWGDLVVCWWIATGELRDPPPAGEGGSWTTEGLPTEVAAALAATRPLSPGSPPARGARP